jgi:hypothetical protein
VNARPSRVRLRAYKVGFGDCLLLSVTYGSKLPDGRTERHILFDCGSVSKADDGPSLGDVAAQIEKHCGGQLDAVVATHRHRDHIRGFGDRNAREAFDRLEPRIVIRPWTDVPEPERSDPQHALDDNHRHFLGVLDQLPQQSEALSGLAFDNAGLAKRAARIAELGFKNPDAIALLEDWAKRSQAHYVTAGEVLDVEEQLPGISIRVLGPPSLTDVPELSRYAKESEEYWLGLAGTGELSPLVKQGDAQSLVRARRVLAPPGGVGAAEWLVRNLDERRISQGFEIVEALDDVLNNTSVILLLTIGTKRLLMPGDAQVENWSFTLDQVDGSNHRALDAGLADALTKVDLYKVGHHGSRNATPKRLFRRWEQSGREIVSVLSTKDHVFDKSVDGAVPKPELITNLGKLGPVHSTQSLGARVWWMDLEASVRTKAKFTFTPGPPMATP